MWKLMKFFETWPLKYWPKNAPDENTDSDQRQNTVHTTYNKETQTRHTNSKQLQAVANGETA